jgi:hypothetical protein
MINFSIHNVTSVDNARVCNSDSDKSGWISINIIAENYSWGEEDQDAIPSEITLFFKNKDLGLAQLQEQIVLGIAKNRREMVEAEQAKENEEAKANG